MNLTKRSVLWFALAVSCAITLLVVADLADDAAAPVAAAAR